MDPSDGGNSNRYSLSSNVWSRGDSYKNDFNAYLVYYDLDLIPMLPASLTFPCKATK